MSFHKTIAIRVCSDKVLIIVIIGPDSIEFYKRMYILFVCYKFCTIYLSQNVTKAFGPEKFVNHLYIIWGSQILRLRDIYHHAQQIYKCVPSGIVLYMYTTQTPFD